MILFPNLPPSRSNLEDSLLIRNVLKSQRTEKGDHTVLMNRVRGISSNLHLYLHLIYPSAHTLPLSFYLPLFPSLLNSLANFVSLSSFPFCLLAHASLCLFSPTNSLII